MVRLLISFLFCAAVFGQPRYELLLKGGHLIDPKNGIDRTMDVAVTSGRITRVAADIPAKEAQKTVDVRGLYVTPGLVDMHVHVYAGTGLREVYTGDWSVYPDGFTFRSGVTTAVDAGSSGWRNFPDFKDRVIDRAQTRIFAFLNIVGVGMAGDIAENKTEDMQPEATAALARKYPGLVVGIKTAHFAGPEWTAVDRAVEAGKLTNLPVMVDFGRVWPQRSLSELVLKHLRPGDIGTHMYAGSRPVVDEQGKLLPFLPQARRRGVLFDLGHGGGGFWWLTAVPAVQQGWVPDIFSTDLHYLSMNRGMKDMTTTMSKMLCLGMPLAEVIRKSTVVPARIIRHSELGQLSVGAVADVAVLRLDKGKFGYLDSRNARFTGTQKLVCELTLRDGRVVWDLNGLAGEE